MDNWKTVLKWGFLIFWGLLVFISCKNENGEIITFDDIIPWVVSISPVDGTTDVQLDTNIFVTFSESMHRETIYTNTSDTECSGTFQLSTNGFASCIEMANNGVSIGSDQTTFSFTPKSNLAETTTHKIKITIEAKDKALNEMLNDYISNTGFATASLTTGSDPTPDTIENDSTPDTIPPYVLEYKPHDCEGATTDIDCYMSVKFSEPMKIESLTVNTTDSTCQGAFQLSDDEFINCTRINAAVVEKGDQKYGFQVAEGWGPGTVVKFKAVKEVQDLSDNDMTADYLATFTTPLRAIDFDGDMEKIHSGITKASFESVSAFMTISIWFVVDFDNVESKYNLFHANSDGTDNRNAWEIFVNKAGQTVTAKIYSANNKDIFRAVTSNGSVQNGRNFVIVRFYNESGYKWDISLNNEIPTVFSFADFGPGGFPTASDKFVSIGKNHWNNNPLKGKIHSIAVWNTKISDIETLYNNGNPKFDLTSNSDAYVNSLELVHWWKLGESNATIGKDFVTANAFDLTGFDDITPDDISDF